MVYVCVRGFECFCVFEKGVGFSFSFLATFLLLLSSPCESPPRLKWKVLFWLKVSRTFWIGAVCQGERLCLCH